MSLFDGFKRLLGGGRRGEPDKPAEPGAPDEQDLLSAEELFTREVEAALRQLPLVRSVTRGDEFSLVVGREEGTHSLFLRNIFVETRDRTPAERAAIIQRFISFVRRPAEDQDALSFREARGRLVPLLRQVTMFHAIDSEKLKVPVRRPFAPFLMECVGIDSEDSIGYVTEAQVEGWKVSADAVFQAARETAAAAFRPGDVRPYGTERGFALWHVGKDDSYESSRLLVPGWLAAFAPRVSGRPVAIVPSRSRVIVGGDGNESCLRVLAETAQREYTASPRSISPALYTVGDGGAVVPLVLPPGHPRAGDVALGHVYLAAGEYQTQQAILQAKLGDGIFVASYKGLRKDELVSSFTTWTEGVPTLLPEAAEIALVPASREVFRVPWQTALALVGERLRREPDLDPPRWRTGAWPDAAILAKPKASALP
jgi:hypothetical protein